MSTSDGGKGGGGLEEVPTEHVVAAQLTKEIERLANEMFAGHAPIAATNVGAGGVAPVAASPGVGDAPPHPFSPAEMPLPDLVPLVPPGSPTPSGAPYFLDHAGPFGQQPSFATLQAPPGWSDAVPQEALN